MLGGVLYSHDIENNRSISTRVSCLSYLRTPAYTLQRDIQKPSVGGDAGLFFRLSTFLLRLLLVYSVNILTSYFEYHTEYFELEYNPDNANNHSPQTQVANKRYSLQSHIFFLSRSPMMYDTPYLSHAAKYFVNAKYTSRINLIFGRPPTPQVRETPYLVWYTAVLRYHLPCHKRNAH